MKKALALILTLICILNLFGCSKEVDSTDPFNSNADSQEVDTTNQPNSNTDTSSPIYKLKEIESIVFDPKGNAIAEALESFYCDVNYVYYFYNIISEYVIVTYTDKSTENVKEALANLHIKISDLDRFGIRYGKTENNQQTPSNKGICEHIWDSGVEIELGTGAYLMEYTCIVCGEKEQQIITIIPPESASNLEFWISENVDSVDFSEYQEKSGMLGGHEYYGKGYAPTVDEYGQQVDPEHCVRYTVTSYPDYSNKEQHVTGIYITDPQISFYGISLDTSFEDFERLIKNQGFEITDLNENYRTASKGKYSITITKEYIVIRVHVENKYGIVF